LINITLDFLPMLKIVFLNIIEILRASQMRENPGSWFIKKLLNTKRKQWPEKASSKIGKTGNVWKN